MRRDDNFAPPPLNSYLPPTLFDSKSKLHRQNENSYPKGLPPSLNDRLPPTLFDRKPTSVEKKSPYYPPKLHEYRTPTLLDRKYGEIPEKLGSNPFSRFRSTENKKKYYEHQNAAQKVSI